jgi:hypothetical protein
MYNMPIKVGFFHGNGLIIFPLFLNGKNSFDIRPVWYKSKDLERIKDIYRGTTVFVNWWEHEGEIEKKLALKPIKIMAVGMLTEQVVDVVLE